MTVDVVIDARGGHFTIYPSSICCCLYQRQSKEENTYRTCDVTCCWRVFITTPRTDTLLLVSIANARTCERLYFVQKWEEVRPRKPSMKCSLSKRWKFSTLQFGLGPKHIYTFEKWTKPNHAKNQVHCLCDVGQTKGTRKKLRIRTRWAPGLKDVHEMRQRAEHAAKRRVFAYHVSHRPTREPHPSVRPLNFVVATRSSFVSLYLFYGMSNRDCTPTPVWTMAIQMAIFENMPGTDFEWFAKQNHVQGAGTTVYWEQVR